MVVDMRGFLQCPTQYFSYPLTEHQQLWVLRLVVTHILQSEKVQVSGLAFSSQL